MKHLRLMGVKMNYGNYVTSFNGFEYCLLLLITRILLSRAFICSIIVPTFLHHLTVPTHSTSYWLHPQSHQHACPYKARCMGIRGRKRDVQRGRLSGLFSCRDVEGEQTHCWMLDSGGFGGRYGCEFCLIDEYRESI